MSASIIGKVAAIIDDTTLVVNVGQAQGVEEGMGFVVYSEHQEIVDPDSGEVLGKWEIVKAQVVVVHVQERMSTVRSLVNEIVENTSTLSAMMVQHSLGQYGAQNQERQPLEVQAAASSGRPQNQPIKVGDLIRLITTDQGVSEGKEVLSEPTPSETSA